jgi:rhamnosyltransferase
MNKIINSKEIAILMATYNGEKYLREQIDSIINQSILDIIYSR